MTYDLLMHYQFLTNFLLAVHLHETEGGGGASIDN